MMKILKNNRVGDVEYAHHLAKTDYEHEQYDV